MNEQAPPARREDFRLVTGGGRYAADEAVAGAAQAVFVRSAVAHADIAGIDTTEAAAAPGVLAVLTGDDVADAGLRGVPVPPTVKDVDGNPPAPPHWPALAREKVAHVGQPVALVLAETEAAARDAAELVEVDYDEREAVVSAAEATAAGAPQIWPDRPGNLAFRWRGGDPDAVEAAMKDAAHVTRMRLASQRIAVAYMEPRAVLAQWHGDAETYELHAGSQGPAVLSKQVAIMMGVSPEQVRVRSNDVGGAFGAKTPAYPEYAALLLAARTLGRPVRWVADRAETFQADNQARDSIMDAELGLDAEGRFVALRVNGTVNMGAFLSAAGTFISTAVFGSCLTGVYRTPAIAADMRCVFTNCAAIGPYRGAGRPEAAYLLERLVDQAARETGRDRVALRRLNMISPDAMPYATPTGPTYDSGDFPGILDAALKRADHAGFAARKAESERRGLLRGLGIGSYLEPAGGAPLETANVRFDATARRAAIASGVHSSGQGHATVLPELFARGLDVPADSIALADGDSALATEGGPAVGSRSLVAAGAALGKLAAEVIERGRALAAERLEASADDIEYAAGEFAVAGTDRTVTLWDVAEGGALDLDTREETPHTFPNGCCVAEVEIDPETGVTRLDRYVSVNDFGTVIDPRIVEGQIHGGAVQGIGQVLGEHVVYESGSGQLITGSFLDYFMPRASDLPRFDVAYRPVPATTNPLGAKGCGEAGTTGALASVMSAVADALASAGAEPPQMPATPEAVRAALAAAGR